MNQKQSFKYIWVISTGGNWEKHRRHIRLFTTCHWLSTTCHLPPWVPKMLTALFHLLPSIAHRRTPTVRAKCKTASDTCYSGTPIKPLHIACICQEITDTGVATPAWVTFLVVEPRSQDPLVVLLSVNHLITSDGTRKLKSLSKEKYIPLNWKAVYVTPIIFNHRPRHRRCRRDKGSNDVKDKVI